MAWNIGAAQNGGVDIGSAQSAAVIPSGTIPTLYYSTLMQGAIGMEKNVAGQKWIVFAFDLTDNTPKTGDAAQITGNLRIDGGAANAIDDTNPTELEDGFYSFDITQAESNGDMILISPASSTSDIQVIGVPGVYSTTAPNFNALGIESDGDLTKVNLCDANTDMVGTDGANTVVPPTEAQMNARTIDSGDYVVVGDTIAGVTLVDTCTTNSDMVGTDSAATEAKQDIIDTNIDAVLVDTSTTIPDQITALNNISTEEVNGEVVDALNVDTYSEPGQGAPSSTPTIRLMVHYLYKMFRNQKEQTASGTSLYNDAASVVDQKRTVSDDGTTATVGKIGTGA